MDSQWAYFRHRHRLVEIIGRSIVSTRLFNPFGGPRISMPMWAGPGQDLDPCGHHLQVCQHRASFLWSHQIWQGFFTNEAASIPGVKVVTTTAHGLPHETTTRGKQPDALITVPQPPGLYGPLLYPTSTTGTAGLTLDFTVVHPVGRRGTEYACDENGLHRAYRAKVTKHHDVASG